MHSLRPRLIAATSFAAIAAAAFAVLATGCADPGTDPPGGAGPDAGAGGGGGGGGGGTAQDPPRGHAALRPWIAEGHYLQWACEPAPHPARPPGAHGSTRICSNAALSASATGEFPVGAASVKELHGSSGISGYAVGIKLAPGTAASSWYWYEVIGTNVVADGAGVSLCAGCHVDAARDHVFTRVE